MASNNDEYIIQASGQDSCGRKRFYKLTVMAKEGINLKVIAVNEDT